MGTNTLTDGWTWNPDSPPNGQVRWTNDTITFEGLEVVPNDDCTPKNMEVKLHARTIGLIAASAEELAGYLDENHRGEIELPQYYSSFDEFGDAEGKAAHYGPEYDEDGRRYRSGVAADPVEAALRSLNGGGQYSTTEYVLHDCLPTACVLTCSSGAILIGPFRDPIAE